MYVVDKVGDEILMCDRCDAVLVIYELRDGEDWALFIDGEFLPFDQIERSCFSVSPNWRTLLKRHHETFCPNCYVIDAVERVPLHPLSVVNEKQLPLFDVE